MGSDRNNSSMPTTMQEIKEDVINNKRSSRHSHKSNKSGSKSPIKQLQIIPNLKTMTTEISNDADDEVSSPGSLSTTTSTDNETVNNNDNNGPFKGLKTIKTLTPTTHKRRSSTKS